MEQAKRWILQTVGIHMWMHYYKCDTEAVVVLCMKPSMPVNSILLQGYRWKGRNLLVIDNTKRGGPQQPGIKVSEGKAELASGKEEKYSVKGLDYSGFGRILAFIHKAFLLYNRGCSITTWLGFQLFYWDCGAIGSAIR